MSEGTTALYILSLEFDYEFKFKYSFLNISGTEFSRYIYDFNVYFYLSIQWYTFARWITYLIHSILVHIYVLFNGLNFSYNFTSFW